MLAMMGLLVAGHVLTAGADAVVTEDEVRWTLEVVLPPGVQPGLQLPLITPLHARVEHPPRMELRPIESAQGITALEVVGSRLARRSFEQVEVATIVLTVPRREGALDPPLLQGTALQRLTLERGWRFAPDSPDLAAHVGFVASPATSHAQRSLVDKRLADRVSPPSSLRIYVDGTRGNVPGRWEDPQKRLSHGAWWGGGLFVLALLGMVLGHRLLSRRVDHERVEAELAAAWRELE
jgi:hypothetical protein